MVVVAESSNSSSNGTREAMAPTPALLPGESHGWRSLVGCSPWGHQESDTTERLHFHFSLSCIGEGNGTPLQYSCLENPRDGGAWWAAVYGVAQSRTRLKRLSSSGGGGGYSNRSSSGSSSSNNRSSKSCSVTLCLTLCDPIDWSTPDSSAPHYLPEFAQTHVY